MSSAVTPFASIDEAVEDVRNGKMVVVVDDPERENEGDLVVAAQFASPDAVNFMATHARGLICLCLTGERCEELGLPRVSLHLSRHIHKAPRLQSSNPERLRPTKNSRTHRPIPGSI